MDHDKVRTKTSAQSDGMSNAGRAVQDEDGVGRSIDGTPLQVLRSPVNTKSFPASWATIRELHDSAKKQSRRPMREQADLGDEYYENDNGNGGGANADQNNNRANTNTNNTRAAPEPISIKPGISNQIGNCSTGERFISPVAQNAGVHVRASFWSGAALPTNQHDHDSLSPVVSKARSARTSDQANVDRNVEGVTSNGRSKDVHTPSKPTLVNTNSGVTRNDKPSTGVAPTTSGPASLSSRRLKRFVARREACIAARSAEAKDTHSTTGGRQERSVEHENKCCATTSQGSGVSGKGATASQRSMKSKPQLNIARRLAMVKDKSEANSTR
jgi:hypothetical protein